MVKIQKQTFRERMIAGRKKKGSMAGYIFMFVLTSVAIGMTYVTGFIDITDGVHELLVGGQQIIFGNTGLSCDVVVQAETCVAPLPLTITLVANQLYMLMYGAAALALVLSFFIKNNRGFTYISAACYLIVALLVIIAPSILVFTDGINNIRTIVRPSLNSGGTTVVVLSGLAAFGNLIVHRASGNL